MRRRPSLRDDEQTRRQAFDNLAAEALRRLGPRRHLALLHFQPRQRIVQGRGDKRVLGAVLAQRASGIASGRRKPQQGEDEHANQRGHDGSETDDGGNGWIASI